MTPDHTMDGRVVVLTGAAGLLGKEYTRALVESGARVALLDSNEAGVQSWPPVPRSGVLCRLTS